MCADWTIGTSWTKRSAITYSEVTSQYVRKALYGPVTRSFSREVPSHQDLPGRPSQRNFTQSDTERPHSNYKTAGQRTYLSEGASVTTQRGDQVRIMFYGCSHRPRMSAMSSPRVGEMALCYTCGRRRIVKGMVTTWKSAVLKCDTCDWKLENKGRLGRKNLISIAVRHSNNFMHRVSILHDGQQDVIKPQSFKQIPLIDDLLLP